MKTLQTIQVLSKVGKILSKIIFICCIVGFCACAVGILSLAAGTETLKLGGVTIKGLIKEQSGYSAGTLYAIMAVGMILCAGEAVLSRFAVHYFKRELDDGTPFCLAGAKELLRLGILAVCIPLGSQILAEIVHAVFSQMLTDVAPLRLDSAGSVSIGVMFIVMSLLCKYGAESQYPGKDTN